MVSCGNLLKSALVAVVMVALVECGSTAEKLATCCTTVNSREITEPITGYLVQRASPPCVRAVIFQTDTGLFCSQLTAPWVRRKIAAFEKEKRQASSVAPSSTASLLSIITSTASPASSSSSRPAVPSTSNMPAGETYSETADE